MTYLSIDIYLQYLYCNLSLSFKLIFRVQQKSSQSHGFSMFFPCLMSWARLLFSNNNTVPYRCNQSAIEPTRLGLKGKPARRCLSVDRERLGMGISVFKIQLGMGIGNWESQFIGIGNGNWEWEWESLDRFFGGGGSFLFGLFPGFAFVD